MRRCRTAPSPALKAKLRRHRGSWPLQRAHPALLADDHGDRLVDHLDLGDGALLGLDQRAARRRRTCLASASISLITVRFSAAGLPRMSSSLLLLVAQLLQLLLDLDGFQPRQLAQADLEDVLGLPLAELEARDQRRLRLVGCADDARSPRRC